MSAYKTIVIKCDGGDLAPGGEWPADYTSCAVIFSDPDNIQENKEIRKAARKAGWKCLTAFDYCPAHAHLK